MAELEEFQSRNEAILRSIIDGTEYVALPQSRIEELLLQLKEVIVTGGGSVSPEDIQAAIEAYLNSHDADIVTEQELSDALAGYYDKDAVDTTLNEKQDTLTAGDNISIATVNGVLTISADTPALTDVQVQTAVDNYLDENSVVFNTSAEITEVLNG